MANNEKTMDVSKPGKVAADASSRPVIVTHRPMVQDPMVKPEANVSDLEPQKDSSSENKSAATSGEKVIEPIDKELKADLGDIDKAAAAAAAPRQKTDTESMKAETSDRDVETSTTSSENSTEEITADAPKGTSMETPGSDAKSDKSGAADEATSAPKDEVKKPSPTSDSAEVDAMVDQAAAGKHKQKQEDEQEAAKQERLQKLIDDKKYFVKTGQVARRRNNRIALALLILIVLVIGLYLAVDAGTLKPGFDVPIHVIRT